MLLLPSFTEILDFILGNAIKNCMMKGVSLMARRKRRPLIPEAREGLDQLKANVMRKQGYQTDPSNPDSVKYEVAKELGIPLKEDYNGNLTSKQAGKVGGNIGGNMVKEMIRMAQENLNKRG